MRPAGHLVLLILALSEHSGAFFGWFTRKTSHRPSPAKQPAPHPQTLPPAPFEMTTADDKFLGEARHLELSPLDSCHYQVVGRLRASCTEMSEEDIAKLGVALFNCQAEVEGRKTYLCTEDMSLAECTAPMDPDTWNAYHIVSNRARSVCYATRQLHFRRHTELTVNTLAHAAMTQLEAMKVLKDGQEELKELTSESLQKVLSSQKDLLSQQEQLQDNQQKTESSINGNLEMLLEEKALIASGHQLVAQMIEGITDKMENVSSHLMEQDAELQEGHKAILDDLSAVQSRSHEVYAKMESNLDLFLSYQNKSAQYYEELMEKLQRMNQSLSTVLHAMDHMQHNVETRLSYIQGFLHWAGGNLNAIHTCVLHGAYFLLLALLMTFLQISGSPRAVLLVLIVVNALSELNQQTALGFRSLTVLLVCTVTGHWTLLNALRCLVKKVPTYPPLPPAHPPHPDPGASGDEARGFLSSTPEKTRDDPLRRNMAEERVLHDPELAEESLEDVSVIASPAPADWRVQHGLRTPVQSSPALKLRRISLSNSLRIHDGPPAAVGQRNLSTVFDALSESKNYSLNSSLSSNLSVSTMSPRQFCQATTRAGQPCRNKASRGQEFCRVHASGQMSYTSQ